MRLANFFYPQKNLARCLTLATFILHSFAGSSFAEDPIKAKTQTVSATVFLQGAQVRAKASVRVPAGSSTARLIGLPANMAINTIQVRVEGGVLLSINPRIDYLSDQPKSEREKVLADSIDLVALYVEKTHSEVYALEREYEMILANKMVGGANSGLKAADLNAVADVFRKRLLEVANLATVARRLEKRGNERLARLQSELNAISAKRNQHQGYVDIELTTNEAKEINFFVQYFTPAAGWTPVYDIRVADTKGKVELALKAQAQNNTGLNWDKIPLTFSTGKPNSDGTVPMYTPYYISLTPPQVVYSRQNAPVSVNASSQADDMASGAAYKSMELFDAKSNFQQTDYQQQLVSTEYTTQSPYSLPSDGQVHTVGLRSDLVEATYQHVAYPRVNKDVFLTARMTGWEKLDLIPAVANVYFNNTSVGTTFLNPDNTIDTLRIGLGIDQRVTVKREILRDPSNKPAIATNRIRDVRIRIQLRNNRSEPIDLLLIDQAPLAMTNEIEIKVDPITKGEYDKESGKASWRLNLEPRGEAQRELHYTVKWPKGKPLSGLNP